MAPLNIEAETPDKRWIEIGQLNPENPPGSMSNNKPDNTREVYVFECSLDDSKSTIYRSKLSSDMEIGQGRVLDTKGLEIIAELKIGDSPYEMKVKTDKSPEPRKVRFTHI